jgi:hypothetical protein
MTSTHQKALAEELHISFVNLEEKGDVAPNIKGPKELKLLPRGQIMHSGVQETVVTVFTRYMDNHFDLLQKCEADDPQMVYAWDLGAEISYFRLKCVPKDHACGWTCTAQVLNSARVPIPVAFREPPETNEYALLVFFQLP